MKSTKSLFCFALLCFAKQTSKQANKQTSKQANKQTSKQANKQASKDFVVELLIRKND
jgi:hypothetical protein